MPVCRVYFSHSILDMSLHSTLMLVSAVCKCMHMMCVCSCPILHPIPPQTHQGDQTRFISQESHPHPSLPFTPFPLYTMAIFIPEDYLTLWKCMNQNNNTDNDQWLCAVRVKQEIGTSGYRAVIPRSRG